MLNSILKDRKKSKTRNYISIVKSIITYSSEVYSLNWKTERVLRVTQKNIFEKYC